jgi:hypothetical protein
VLLAPVQLHVYHAKLAIISTIIPVLDSAQQVAMLIQQHYPANLAHQIAVTVSLVHFVYPARAIIIYLILLALILSLSDIITIKIIKFGNLALLIAMIVKKHSASDVLLDGS